MQSNTPLIDLATRLKDNTARLTKNRENMKDTFHGLDRVVARLRWIRDMENYFGGLLKPWTNEIKKDYETFLAQRGDDQILQVITEHVNNLGFQYRGVIGASSEYGRLTNLAMELAAPEFKNLANRTVNVTGLSQDVTKPSPEAAAAAEEASEHRDSLPETKAAPNLAGPSL